LRDNYSWLEEDRKRNDSAELKILFGGSKKLVQFINEYSEPISKINSIRIELKGKKSPKFIVTGSEAIKDMVKLIVSNNNRWKEMAEFEERKHLGEEGIKLHKKTTLTQLKSEAAKIIFSYLSDPKSSNKEVTKTQKYILGGSCLLLIKMIDPKDKKFMLPEEFNNYLYTNFERALTYPEKK